MKRSDRTNKVINTFRVIRVARVFFPLPVPIPGSGKQVKIIVDYIQTRIKSHLTQKDRKTTDHTENTDFSIKIS
jgi:hypothetical protein